jgi:cadmium resistance protein CadD (predicted permease)
MTNFRSYALPFVAAVLIAAGAGLLWEFLDHLATNDWWKLLVYLSMCLLTIAAMIGVQALLPAAPATTPVQQVSRHG